MKPSTPMTPEQKAERLRVAAIDGAAARAEYDAAHEHEDEKIARLRALRMERDRLEAEEAARAAKAKARLKAKPKSKGKGVAEPAAKRVRRKVTPS